MSSDMSDHKGKHPAVASGSAEILEEHHLSLGGKSEFGGRIYVYRVCPI